MHWYRVLLWVGVDKSRSKVLLGHTLTSQAFSNLAQASCSFHSGLELVFSFLLATQAQIKPAQGSFSGGEAILRTELAKNNSFPPSWKHE